MSWFSSFVFACHVSPSTFLLIIAHLYRLRSSLLSLVFRRHGKLLLSLHFMPLLVRLCSSSLTSFDFAHHCFPPYWRAIAQLFLIMAHLHRFRASLLSFSLSFSLSLSLYLCFFLSSLRFMAHRFLLCVSCLSLFVFVYHGASTLLSSTIFDFASSGSTCLSLYFMALLHCFSVHRSSSSLCIMADHFVGESWFSQLVFPRHTSSFCGCAWRLFSLVIASHS